ncbi:hypothetical protein HDZ31DRAFT_42396 [Schizophyllum fasciatum]
MPTDNALHLRKSRKSPKKDLDLTGSLTRELDFKRSKGEISCAECRRLKIKCSKTVPCDACVRRGCAPLCPNGSLATGQGTRFVFEATEHLHRHVANLKERIKVLEQALSSMQRERSSEMHPLLVPPSSPTGSEDMDLVHDRGDSVPSQEGEALDTNLMGTLSISSDGLARYFGSTGGTESLLMHHALCRAKPCPALSVSPWMQCETSGPASLLPSPTASVLSGSTSSKWPKSSFSALPLPSPIATFDDVLSHLPSADEAMSLIDTYFEALGWLFGGVTREQVEGDMISAIYGAQEGLRSASPVDGSDCGNPHAIAVLFAIFAIASAVEQAASSEMPASRAALFASSRLHRAGRYSRLAHASLTLRETLQRPSIYTVQALYLLSVYHDSTIDIDRDDDAADVRDVESRTELCWNLLSTAAQLSQAVHRNSRHWGLPEGVVHRREVLVWHLYTAGVWQSLYSGRPPPLALQFMDCAMPEYSVMQRHLFEHWQFNFAAECVSQVVASIVSAGVPTYATIMALDRKIRDFPLLPAHDCTSITTNGRSRAYITSQLKETGQRNSALYATLFLYLHRSFFARAVAGCPDNPLRSPYSHSVLTVCRASSAILKSVKDQFLTAPASLINHWSMWTSAFAAAVVHGMVAIHAPRSPIVATSKEELEQACILFARAAPSNARASQALLVLKSLSLKAGLASGCDGAEDESSQADAARPDELSIFAGCIYLHSTISRTAHAPPVPDTPPVSAHGDGGSPALRDIVMSGCVQSDPLTMDSSAIASAGPLYMPRRLLPVYTAQAQEAAQPPACHALWAQEGGSMPFTPSTAGVSDPGVTAWAGLSAPFSYPPPEYSSTDEGHYALTYTGTEAAAGFAHLAPHASQAPPACTSERGFSPVGAAHGYAPEMYRVRELYSPAANAQLRIATAKFAEEGMSPLDMQSDFRWDDMLV